MTAPLCDDSHAYGKTDYRVSCSRADRSLPIGEGLRSITNVSKITAPEFLIFEQIPAFIILLWRVLMATNGELLQVRL